MKNAPTPNTPNNPQQTPEQNSPTPNTPNDFPSFASYARTHTRRVLEPLGVFGVVRGKLADAPPGTVKVLGKPPFKTATCTDPSLTVFVPL